MIGDKLLPEQFWADEQEAIKHAKQRAEQIGDQNKKNAEMQNIEELEIESKRNAQQWRTWYLVLKDYFDLPDQPTRESFYAYGTVHAVGWVGFVLIFLSHHFNWLAAIWCALLVIYGIQGVIFRIRCGGYFGPDNQLVPLTSAILHHIRKDPSDKLTISH